MNRVGQMLREARRAARMSQAQLETRSGVAKSAISMYENGSREPGADVFIRLLSATDSHLSVEHFGAEDIRRGRILSDLLRFAEELPHRWAGDNLKFPSHLWRAR